MTRTAALLATLIFAGGLASADKAKDRQKADELFKRGKKLMSQKRYSDACKAFEQSYKLDPQIGGELNIARCYEEWGKLSRAYHSYRHAAKMAKDANDSRLPKIRELVDRIESEVPRLTIKVPEGADVEAAEVKIDGVTVSPNELGEPQMVDPGPHLIEYVGKRGKKKTKVVPLERGGSSEVALELPKAHEDEHADHHEETHEGGHEATPDGNGHETTAPEHPGKEVASSDPGKGFRIGAYVTGAAGIAAVGVSSYLALSARSKYNDALDAHCGGMKDACDDIGLAATHDARHQANIASIVFGAGLAAIGGGVVLYLLAPGGETAAEHDPGDHARYVVPTVGPDHAGLVLGGRL